MKKRHITLLGGVGFVAFLSGGWLLQRGSAEQGRVYHQARLLDQIVAHVAGYYVDSLDERELYNLAIDGMLRGLGDPYTTFLREEDFQNLALSTSGNYGGLGIRIESSDGWVTVVTTLTDTPAERAGMLAGDRLVEVDGQSMAGWSADRAVAVLRGEAGTAVKVRVLRPGIPELLDFAIERAPIHVSAVRHAEMVAPTIAYVWLEGITEDAGRELAEEVTALRDRGATKLILDLRYNPGGVLGQAIAVSDLFLDRGDVVVETRGREARATRDFRADHEERWGNVPVVVLVNEFSASAAEIIAGALQDHDRALIMGTTTFGKGLVQTVFPFSRTSALKLTTGRWYTPLGRSIQRDRHGARTIAAASLPGDTGDVAVAAGPDANATFLTEGGRRIQGGGGIHPDVTVTPDTLTDDEQALRRLLASDLPRFRDVLGTFALELRGADAVTDVEFDVTDQMRRDLWQRLRERGIDIPQGVFEKASDWVSNQLRYQVLRFGFGLDAEMRRRTGDDAVVRRAIEVLEHAEAPAAVFGRASPAR